MDVFLTELSIGEKIKNKRFINPTMVKYWKFSKECADIGGGIPEGRIFEICEVDKKYLWVRVIIPAISPPHYLKIAGIELGANFVRAAPSDL